MTEIGRLLSLPRYTQDIAEETLRSQILNDSEKRTLASHLDIPGALSMAVRDGYTEVVRLFLNSGATAIYINLLEAVERGRIEIARLLLDKVPLSRVSDILPEALLNQSSEMIELFANEERTRGSSESGLISYVLFLRTLTDTHPTALESIDLLIDRRIAEVQLAARRTLFRDELSHSPLSTFQQVYYDYFCHLARGENTENKLALLLIANLR